MTRDPHSEPFASGGDRLGPRPKAGECPILCVGMTESKERHVYEDQQ
jgi:hypothetical protein